MSEVIRVAQVVGKMCNGGVENVVLNYYRNIDRERIQFDFIVDEDSTNILKDEIECLGGRVFIVPPYQNITKYIPALIKIFRENNYKIVHSHLNTLSVFPLYAAKKAGVPVRIAHNHSTAGKGETKKNILKYILRPFGKIFPTHLAACTEFAGEWMWGKKAVKNGKVTIFYNAIDLNKFKKDEAIRNEIRRELGFEGKFVIGHVGRFCYQKNQEFLIEIFREIYKRNKNVALMLVGEGETEDKIKRLVHNMEFNDNVIFMGARHDVEKLYQAMDVFVLPSRYEGLGMVAIEAQAVGLPIVASTKVPEEANVTNSMLFLNLQSSPKKWADAILKYKLFNKKNVKENMINSGYEINSAAKRLEELYLQYYYS